jgi:hypothetical protein
MFGNPSRIRLVMAVAAALSFAALFPKHLSAQGPDSANLTERFKYLSEHGNVECSVQFEKLIGTMGANGRLQGSCCAPMDEARYRQQLEGLKKYADIGEVPPDGQRRVRSDCPLSARSGHSCRAFDLNRADSRGMRLAGAYSSHKGAVTTPR